MSARITINVAADGVFEMWLNEEGRDLLVRELQRLNDDHEHLHLAPKGQRLGDGITAQMGDIEVCSNAYHQGDNVLEWGKILFRLDKWDKEHFPHVFDEGS